MSNEIKFKILNPFGITKSKKTINNYYDVPVDPSYGDILLLCNVKDLSFDEVIFVILNKHRKSNLLGAISFVYWKYSLHFLKFIQECSEKEYKIIKKKCFSHFKRIFNFVKRSDDTLYTQNENLRNIYLVMKSK